MSFPSFSLQLLDPEGGHQRTSLLDDVRLLGGGGDDSAVMVFEMVSKMGMTGATLFATPTGEN